MYSLIYSDKMLKQLYKLNKELQDRIIKTLERARIRPHYHTKKLVGSPHYSLRAGDYRIILDIVDKKLIIFVIEVGHRKRVYKS